MERHGSWNSTKDEDFAAAASLAADLADDLGLWAGLEHTFMGGMEAHLAPQPIAPAIPSAPQAGVVSNDQAGAHSTSASGSMSACPRPEQLPAFSAVMDVTPSRGTCPSTSATTPHTTPPTTATGGVPSANPRRDCRQVTETTSSNQRRNSHSSRRINVRLLPVDRQTEEHVRRAGFNPKLELCTPVTKSVAFLYQHLLAKWATVSSIVSLKLHLTSKITGGSAPKTPSNLPNQDSCLSTLAPHFAIRRKGRDTEPTLSLTYSLSSQPPTAPLKPPHITGAAAVPAMTQAAVKSQCTSVPSSQSLAPIKTKGVAKEAGKRKRPASTGPCSNVGPTKGDVLQTLPCTFNANITVQSGLQQPFSSTSTSNDAFGGVRKRKRIRPLLVGDSKSHPPSPPFAQENVVMARCPPGDTTKENSFTYYSSSSQSMPQPFAMGVIEL